MFFSPFFFSVELNPLRAARDRVVPFRLAAAAKLFTVRLHVARAGTVVFVLVVVVAAVQRDVPDGRPSAAPVPLLVAGLGLGQQLGAAQRDDGRSDGRGQQDGYDAHRDDRPSVLDGVLVAVLAGRVQHGRAQNGLKKRDRLQSSSRFRGETKCEYKSVAVHYLGYGAPGSCAASRPWQRC